jgi:hypothetical protein
MFYDDPTLDPNYVDPTRQETYTPASQWGIPVGSVGSVNVSPKPADEWTNYLIYGALALGVYLVFFKR